ncbi:MAG: quinol:cytochrome C oxidoreductase [Chlorobi bacterium]|nr:quinol:cytochrome C oxidoreductase [Chlorobiota bacterium]
MNLEHANHKAWRKPFLLSIGLIAFGLLSALVGYFVDGHVHFVASWLTYSVFFIGIALAAVFFIAVHTIAHGGWQVAFLRVPEAMMTFIFFGGIILIITLLGIHDLYHWAHEELIDPNSEYYDPLIAHKAPWLNVPFFVSRTIVYLALWIVLAMWLRNLSQKLDETGNLRYWQRIQFVSGLFLAVFAVTSTLSAFDWVMSTDPHWYSTLFGWYLFSVVWVSMIAVLILWVLWLRKHGINPYIRDEHLHDLGKYLFGFSIFWAYLWYSQYMLHWYANIPEETAWHLLRFKEHRILFYLIIILNFGIPFFALMSRSAKRKPWVLTTVALIVLIGHVFEVWLLVHPSVYHAHHLDHWTFSLVDLGALSFLTGLFIFVTMLAMKRAPIAPEKHPYFKESLTYKT